MINLHYTKNILDGALQGAQLATVVKCDDAAEAVAWMLIIVEGVQHDCLLGAGYTAHNFRFVSELAHELDECGADCEWCKEAAADAAFDLREDN